jgi:hypothetical protein
MTSPWRRLKDWRIAHRLNEGDAPADTDVAMTREEGGDPDSDTPSTTGTGRSGSFVGRVAGEDAAAGPTGAEARAEQRKQEPDS